MGKVICYCLPSGLIARLRHLYEDRFFFICVSDREELLRRVEAEKPNLIVWYAPAVIGRDFGAKGITGRDEFRYLANILLAEEDTWECAAMEAGMDDYLVLPTRDEVLCARINRAVLLKDALRQAREQMWMAFAYRNAALAESLFVYEVNLDTAEVALLATSEQAKQAYYPLKDYASGDKSAPLYHPEDWPQIPATFCTENLWKLFRNGVEETKLNYRILNRSGGWDWVETKIHFLKTVYGEPRCVAYVKLIDEQVTKKNAVERILREEVERILSIDPENGWFETLYDTKRTELEEGRYPERYEAAIRTFAEEETKQELLRKLSLPALKRELEENENFLLTIPYHTADGTAARKKLLAFYADERRQRIIVAIRDVTALLREEQAHQEKLEIALTAAKQASAAKSSFLSRMSHEIRTPMNAIIGMDTLAAQAIGNDERVADCICKIGISARYLLALINDILDMSRIESGKLLLKNEPFPFQEFIKELNTLIYNQAAAKGLDYECLVDSRVGETYIGDAMKLQQILVNVLGNAVKFTQKGKVSLEVKALNRTGERIWLQFSVNDTGSGIREADLERIFEPFEQADDSATTPFGGTGLGLAITKNLVELMGGTIRVRSIVHVGSEFTITIPLAEDEHETVRLSPGDHFEKLHTLIVDDDVLVCEQTAQLLREIGMQGQWVSSGREAVACVRSNHEKGRTFDFILVDWKMNEMSGVETTREIRRIVGPDVTIIIISAYDWESIEAEARAAGANLLISKPLFKSTLVSAFHRARGQTELREAPAPVYDFTGKRILLAEDNQINAEIVRCLLEQKNCAVEDAENGLRAMELFVQNPAGYYDAILMDVRMPMMDGLQATTNIRHWNRSDAAGIPIIAITANAFDEDVEKSRAAGVNAHLSKPIEPNFLYYTLQRLLNGESAGI